MFWSLFSWMWSDEYRDKQHRLVHEKINRCIRLHERLLDEDEKAYCCRKRDAIRHQRVQLQEIVEELHTELKALKMCRRYKEDPFFHLY